MTVQEAIRTAVEGRCLGEEEAYRLAGTIMDGQATPAQIGGLLIALRMRGETADELLGFARAARDRMVRVPILADNLLDTCGTGGDGAETFNISTVAAIVAAAAGCRVAKHGNRAVSGRCGSADVLQSLGVNIHLSPKDCARCIERIGVGFLYAPSFHQCLSHAAAPRREIAVRTLLNLVGPLANPAGARRQLIGVFDMRFVEPLVYALQRLGAYHCLVVHGEDGLDELTTTGVTHVAELRDGVVHRFALHPEELGTGTSRACDLRGGDAETNARIALSILAGAPGPARDIVVLNAAAAIYTAGRTPSIAEGIALASEAIDSGRALATLRALQHFAAGSHS